MVVVFFMWMEVKGERVEGGMDGYSIQIPLVWFLLVWIKGASLAFGTGWMYCPLSQVMRRCSLSN